MNQPPTLSLFPARVMTNRSARATLSANLVKYARERAIADGKTLGVWAATEFYPALADDPDALELVQAALQPAIDEETRNPALRITNAISFLMSRHPKRLPWLTFIVERYVYRSSLED
jgi:hypothetical protein